jgi:hypothetical protein
MDLKTLQDTPPWEWPEGADKLFIGILRDGKAAESDRLIAAELARDFTVINMFDPARPLHRGNSRVNWLNSSDNCARPVDRRPCHHASCAGSADPRQGGRPLA